MSFCERFLKFSVSLGPLYVFLATVYAIKETEQKPQFAINVIISETEICISSAYSIWSNKIRQPLISKTDSQTMCSIGRQLKDVRRSILGKRQFLALFSRKKEPQIVQGKFDWQQNFTQLADDKHVLVHNLTDMTNV